ncbi:GNAT family N-acetyltransferase [Anaerosporobacter faecicola]|uniref:GNAT family N-acetyltransferase n=1 Tax=Anaerosporobacter faecicola TaxID=2718714 RepID=UPI00143C1CDC|nr:GNAT family protein [Anaerosporobacter faecicola]
MLRLRPYKSSDAPYLLQWFHDEESFTKWCANKFTYPLTTEQLASFKVTIDDDPGAWSFVALNEAGIPVGHLHMRNADYTNQSIHFGFIVVDDRYRGKGYGKEMLQLAITYATTILKMKKITLGVFGNNPAAHACYKKVGFVDEQFHPAFFTYQAEKWDLYDMVYLCN